MEGDGKRMEGKIKKNRKRENLISVALAHTLLPIHFISILFFFYLASFFPF